MRDGEKDTSTETNGRNQVLEQFTKLIEGFADFKSEELESLADKETEADAESYGYSTSTRHGMQTNLTTA